MKKKHSFLYLKALQKHGSFLSLLCYFCTYIAVLGLNWAEHSDLLSWYWKLAILLFCSVLFLVSIVRSNSFEKTLQFVKEQEKEISRLREQNGIQKLELNENIQGNQKRARFLAQICHEIRNPLNAILGFTELLGKRNLDAQSQQYVTMLTQSGDGLRLLLNDILDLDKIDGGKLKLESSSFDFKELISSTILPYTYMAKQKNLEFELICDPTIPQYLLADPYRFRQILLNLISNSLKFTKQGSIRVQFMKQWENDDNVIIRTLVSDTGIGIKEDQLQHVFKPYIQSKPSTTREYGGSGLGLSIVSELVSLMDGEISVQSPNPLLKSEHQAPGTHFILDINFRIDTRKKSSPTHTLQEPALEYKLPEPIHVLIADDNMICQVLFQHILESMGARVDLVTNGEEAIAAVRQTPYHLIFMDIQMPIIDGLSASRHIRNELGLLTPIIGVTASSFKEDIKAAQQAGMNDYIPKPFRQKEIYDKVCRWGIKKAKENSTNKSEVLLPKTKPLFQGLKNDKNINLP